MKKGVAMMVVFLVVSLLCLAVYTGAAEKGPVKVGLVTWRSGPFESAGRFAVGAGKLAVKQLNDKGGILGGRTVKMNIYDEGYTPDSGIAAAKRAISDGCVALVGYQDATTALPAASVCKEANLPIAYGTQGAKAATADPNINYWGMIRIAPYADPYEGTTAKWIESKGYKTVVLLGNDSQYTRESERGYRNVWDRPGSSVKLLDAIYFPYTKTEAAAEMTKAVGHKPDFIQCGYWGTGLIVSSWKTMKDLGYKGDFGLYCHMLDQPTVDADPQACEGAFCYYTWVYDPSEPAGKKFHDEYLELNGFEPENMAEIFYEAMMTTLLALEKAGTTSDLKKIGDAMHSVDWVTPTGDKFTVRQDGQRVSPTLYVCQVRGGRLVLVDKFPFATELY